MEAKKVNIFAFIMVIVMCVFTIFISTRNTGAGKNGIDGKDGNDMNIVSLYNEYKENNPSYTGSLSDFIEYYLGDLVADLDDETTKASLSAQSALCSTVDICFAYSIPANSYYNVSTTLLQMTSGEVKYGYRVTAPSSPFMNVAAGSGVIYKMETEAEIKTAYIITNFHVAYVEAYSNDADYKVFYNQSTGEVFSAKDDAIINNGLNGNYMFHDAVVEAPVETHFLDSYSIYLNGYQSKDSALSASYVGGSAENDIAVLKVEYDSVNDADSNNALIFNGNYAEATLADSDSVCESDYVVAVGNPLIPNTNDINMSQITTYEQYLDAIEEAYIDSLCLTTTGGRISQTTCEMPFTSLLDSTKVNNMRLVQVDAAINPGNSGGGLYNLSGKLVGIVNGKIADASYDNVGFAIPINIASRIADQIIAQCDETDNKTIYRLSTDSLGLVLKEIAGETNKPTYDGVWHYAYDVTVESLTYGTKGASNFQVGDVIKSVKFEGETNEHLLTRDYQFDDLMLLADYPSSSTTTVIFKVLRNNTEISISIEFASLDFKEVI